MKLTNQQRGEIIKVALRDKFDTETHSIRTDEIAVMKKCYERKYPLDIMKFIENHKEMFYLTSDFSVNAGGYNIILGWWPYDFLSYNNHQEFTFSVGNDYRMNSYPLISLNLNNNDENEIKLCHDVRKIAERKEDLYDRKTKAKTALKNMLQSITTTKRLMEIWPEGLPYYKNLDNTIRVNVPIVTIEEVNKIFALPKEEEVT